MSSELVRRTEPAVRSGHDPTGPVVPAQIVRSVGARSPVLA